MTSRIKSLTIASTVAAIAAAAPASASSFVFSTVGNNTVTSGSAVFASNTVGGTTLNVRVSAWQAVDKSGNADIDDIRAASLGLWDAGLGVIGQGESTSGNDHQIDNVGAVDFIMLQFDQAVSLTSIYRNVFKLDNITTSDSDAAYWADTSGSLGTNYNSAIPLANYDISEKLWTDIAGASSASTGTLTGNSTVYGSAAVPTSNVWLVGASFLATDRDDGFKIASLTVNYTPAAAVPEPATWAMMVVGFGFLGGALRRRRAAGQPAVTFG